jgi:hypothetical protein
MSKIHSFSKINILENYIPQYMEKKIDQSTAVTQSFEQSEENITTSWFWRDYTTAAPYLSLT